MPKTTKLFFDLLPALIVFVFVGGFFGCYPEPEFVPDFPNGQIEGYAPIYVPESEANSIEFGAAQPLVSPGKIYIYGKYLLVNEKFRGIHVFDNTDPSHPAAVGFLRIAGNVDLAVQNDVLYADHLTDMVAIKVTDWNNIAELSRFAQGKWSKKVPPGDGNGRSYFECPDASKGVVIGWEIKLLNNPKCFR